MDQFQKSELIREFLHALTLRDWWSSMSDDHRDYRRGEEQRKELGRLFKDVEVRIGREFAVVLWNEFAAPGHQIAPEEKGKWGILSRFVGR